MFYRRVARSIKGFASSCSPSNLVFVAAVHPRHTTTTKPKSTIHPPHNWVRSVMKLAWIF